MLARTSTTGWPSWTSQTGRPPSSWTCSRRSTAGGSRTAPIPRTSTSARTAPPSRDAPPLAVPSQPADFDSSHGFGGVTLYDTTDPYHPVQLGQVATGGVHDVQIDPGYPRRPYIYAANFESDDPVHAHHVSIIDASDPRGPPVPADPA